MIDLSEAGNYYVAWGYTDLRRGIDGLASIVNLQYGMELKEDILPWLSSYGLSATSQLGSPRDLY